MSKVIKVKGVGKVKTAVDCIVINFSIIKTMKEYDGLVDYAKQQYDLFIKGIKAKGYTANDIKTTNFVVSVEQKFDGREQINDGYRINHSFTLQIAFDMKKLAGIIDVINQKNMNITFNLEFTVKDKSAIKNQCIKQAVADAKSKAEIIAESLGVKLHDILEVVYGVSSSPRSSSARVMPLMASAVSDGFEIQVDDIESCETVDITWDFL